MNTIEESADVRRYRAAILRDSPKVVAERLPPGHSLSPDAMKRIEQEVLRQLVRTDVQARKLFQPDIEPHDFESAPDLDTYRRMKEIAQLDGQGPEVY